LIENREFTSRLIATHDDIDITFVTELLTSMRRDRRERERDRRNKRISRANRRVNKSRKLKTGSKSNRHERYLRE
jgi:hypothetical protein